MRFIICVILLCNYLAIIIYIKNTYMNNSNKILTSLGAGVLVGAVLGILFAPDKGTETRKKISGQGKKIVDDVQNKFRRGRDKFNDLKDDLIQTAKEKGDSFI
jgi:gas vesicle protein